MIVIIGAGVTGLTVAASLKADTMLIEKDCKVGGYCQTTKRSGYVWDRAGHFFHFNRDNIKQFFAREIPERNFIAVEKRTSIDMGKWGLIDFPIQKNIHQLPKNVYIDCLIDLYHSEKTIGHSSSFKEYVYNKLGKKLSDIFLIPYNEKLYACDLNSLDSEAMGRFFPSVTFEEVLLNAKNQHNQSYNSKFLYPKNGAEVFIEVLHSHAIKNSNVLLESEVVSIDINKQQLILSDQSLINYSVLVNTMPLDIFCKLASINVYKEELTANKVAVFNLGFDSKCDDGYHWKYYPGSEVFYRVGCYHNIFGTKQASLYVEIGMNRDQVVNEEMLLSKTLNDLKDAGMVSDSMCLVDYEFIIMDPAYVHINKKSEKFKRKVKNMLKNKNVYTAGRYGNWRYCSIEDNIHEADLLAKKISNKYTNVRHCELFK